jgi:hypothetical protein
MPVFGYLNQAKPRVSIKGRKPLWQIYPGGGTIISGVQ